MTAQCRLIYRPYSPSSVSTRVYAPHVPLWNDSIGLKSPCAAVGANTVDDRSRDIEALACALPSPFSSRRADSTTLRRAGRSSSTISQISAGSTRR